MIHIGDMWINVPEGYVQAETLYCKAELTAFDIAPEGHLKEMSRQAVLDKRVEFYNQFDITSLQQPIIIRRTICSLIRKKLLRMVG